MITEEDDTIPSPHRLSEAVHVVHTALQYNTVLVYTGGAMCTRKKYITVKIGSLAPPANHS